MKKGDAYMAKRGGHTDRLGGHMKNCILNLHAQRKEGEHSPFSTPCTANGCIYSFKVGLFLSQNVPLFILCIHTL